MIPPLWLASGNAGQMIDESIIFSIRMMIERAPAELDVFRSAGFSDKLRQIRSEWCVSAL